MEGISVVGCGRWGTFLAWYAATHCGIPAVLYGRSSSPDFIELRDTGRNRYLSLPRGVSMTDDLDAALGNDTIVVSIGSQNLRGFCREVAGRSLPGRGGLAGKTFLLAMKGLETPSAKVLSQVFREELGEKPRLAILAGPGHVQDYVREIPSCAVVDSDDAKVKEGLAGSLSSRLIRFYIGGDFVGNQVGAALKNVVGIAAGILDGLGWRGLKGGLMTRAPIEVGRLIRHYGGNPLSAYGLAHLGDYEATLFSEHSHNRLFGESFAKGEKMDEKKLAEGYHTLAAVHSVAVREGLDMPIVRALYGCVYENADIESSIRALFDRDMKAEAIG